MPGKRNINDINFFAGGKALFTVFNDKKHLTFSITRVKATRGPKKYRYFAKYVIDSKTQVYVGEYHPEIAYLRLTEASRYKQDSIIVKSIRWAIRIVKENLTIADNYGIMHSGKCGRCRRELTNPTSIQIGLGPVCLEEVRKQHG